MSLRRDSNLGELDFQVVQDEIAHKKSERKISYQKYSEEAQFKIGKYASENGATAAVRKFKNLYPDMKESTVQGFKSNYDTSRYSFLSLLVFLIKETTQLTTSTICLHFSNFYLADLIYVKNWHKNFKFLLLLKKP